MYISRIMFQGTIRPQVNTKQNSQFESAFRQACKDVFVPYNKDLQREAHEQLHNCSPMNYKQMVSFFKDYILPDNHMLH